MLKVLVVNDDLTPTQFVVSVLQDIFGHSKQVAEKTALLADLNGKAVCGICREYVEANSLVSSATAVSRQHGYPLGFCSPSSTILGARRWIPSSVGDEGHAWLRGFLLLSCLP